MARTTVEDCLGHISNRYDLVMLASRRAHQLNQMARPLITTSGSVVEKPTVIALREIAETMVTLENIDSLSPGGRSYSVANSFAEPAQDAQENTESNNVWASATATLQQQQEQNQEQQPPQEQDGEL